MQQSDLENATFWAQLAPDLETSVLVQKSEPVNLDVATLKAASHSMETDGYLKIAPVFTPDELEPLCTALQTLQSAGLPAVYIYVYEHPWALFRRLRPLISHFLGNRFSLLPNFWAWHIPCVEGASGWPRHRDCDGQTRFENPDGGQTLMSLSLWVPLTDATIENGCMYVLPRSRQGPPYSASSGDVVHHAPDSGRALPAKAGSVLGWAQDLYHWSGQVQAGASVPRISLSLEFQNTAFAPMAQPLLDIATPPPFEERLALVQRQIPKYRHMENPTITA